MKAPTRQAAFLFALLFPCLLFAKVEYNIDTTGIQSLQSWTQKVTVVRYECPDSALQMYQFAYEHFLAKQDTFSAIGALTEKAIIYGHKAKYQLAYDHLWKALLLADVTNDRRAKGQVYIHLGRYFSFYKRKEKALEYFQSALTLSKELVAEKLAPKQDITNCYYAICSTYRELNEPEQANTYLDSCLLYNGGVATPYLQFEEANIKSAFGEHQAALDLITMLESWFKENSPSFQVLLFASMGDVYYAMGDKENAEKAYQKSLKASDRYKSHLDFIPTVYERLSNLYLSKGNYQSAFTSLQRMKELDMQFFDSRSPNNHSLLEIKDQFQFEKEQQKQLIQQQRLTQLEHQKREAFLKNTLLTVTIGFLLFSGFLYLNYVRNRHESEKQLIKRKKELEIKQAGELLELKNKELATSSLKLIEKDEILATLKEKLSKGSGDLKANELKKIVRSISHSNAQNWEDFEARFVSVNKNFYQKLNTNYPKLSRGDQKLCALVKLHLSSKEMAKLLGISIESVHTNRYRLRKKLGLTREVSLTEFIAQL
ncbi:MAG: transcriptional regulator [Bacteroidota bacterium]